jgi:hypothetical protein
LDVRLIARLDLEAHGLDPCVEDVGLAARLHFAEAVGSVDRQGAALQDAELQRVMHQRVAVLVEPQVFERDRRGRLLQHGQFRCLCLQVDAARLLGKRWRADAVARHQQPRLRVAQLRCRSSRLQAGHLGFAQRWQVHRRAAADVQRRQLAQLEKEVRVPHRVCGTRRFTECLLQLRFQFVQALAQLGGQLHGVQHVVRHLGRELHAQRLQRQHRVDEEHRSDLG